MPLTAKLTDPDGGVHNVDVAVVQMGPTEITDATSDTYKPVGQREGDDSGDNGDTLTVTATYADAEGAVDADDESKDVQNLMTTS